MQVEVGNTLKFKVE